MHTLAPTQRPLVSHKAPCHAHPLPTDAAITEMMASASHCTLCKPLQHLGTHWCKCSHATSMVMPHVHSHATVPHHSMPGSAALLLHSGASCDSVTACYTVLHHHPMVPCLQQSDGAKHSTLCSLAPCSLAPCSLSLSLALWGPASSSLQISVLPVVQCHLSCHALTAGPSACSTPQLLPCLQQLSCHVCNSSAAMFATYWCQACSKSQMACLHIISLMPILWCKWQRIIGTTS